MKEQLISFNTAKLARDKGFHEETMTAIIKSNSGKEIEMYYSTGEKIHPLLKFIAWLPTQSLLQKWLRDKHKIIVEVTPCDSWHEWHYKVIGEDSMAPFYEICSGGGLGEYKTYEEALEDGLFNALTLAL